MWSLSRIGKVSESWATIGSRKEVAEKGIRRGSFIDELELEGDEMTFVTKENAWLALPSIKKKDGQTSAKRFPSSKR